VKKGIMANRKISETQPGYVSRIPQEGKPFDNVTPPGTGTRRAKVEMRPGQPVQRSFVPRSPQAGSVNNAPQKPRRSL
jgi:hypothetical protein